MDNGDERSEKFSSPKQALTSIPSVQIETNENDNTKKRLYVPSKSGKKKITEYRSMENGNQISEKISAPKQALRSTSWIRIETNETDNPKKSSYMPVKSKKKNISEYRLMDSKKEFSGNIISPKKAITSTFSIQNDTNEIKNPKKRSYVPSPSDEKYFPKKNPSTSQLNCKCRCNGLFG